MREHLETQGCRHLEEEGDERGWGVVGYFTAVGTHTYSTHSNIQTRCILTPFSVHVKPTQEWIAYTHLYTLFLSHTAQGCQCR